SSASLVPSVQCTATHVPIPSQTSPPPSVHMVPLGASSMPHVWATGSQTEAAHVVPAGQSLVERQGTHAPAPSQNFPFPSEHAVPLAAGLLPHTWVSGSQVAA